MPLTQQGRSSRTTVWLTHLKISGLLLQSSSHSSPRVYVWSLILLPLGKLSDPVFVCALTYLDSSSHHKKTITIIFLVMRFSTGTGGYGTHIHVMTWLTPPNSVCEYAPDVNDTMSPTLKAFTSLRKYQPAIIYFLWDMKMIKICFKTCTSHLSLAIPSVMRKGGRKKKPKQIK